MSCEKPQEQRVLPEKAPKAARTHDGWLCKAVAATRADLARALSPRPSEQIKALVRQRVRLQGEIEGIESRIGALQSEQKWKERRIGEIRDEVSRLLYGENGIDSPLLAEDDSPNAYLG